MHIITYTNVVEDDHGDSVTIALNEYLVLTAAHCLQKPENETFTIEIHLGGTPEKNFTDVSIIKEFDIIIHPKFDPHKYVDDIGLIKFKSPEKLTSDINIACIPFDDAKVPKNLSLAGFGEDSSVDTSKYTEFMIPEVALLNCSEMYFNIANNISKEVGLNLYNPITIDQFCAGNETRKRGNSGMPVMKRDDKTRSPTIYGLISYGAVPKHDKMPTVFTKIHSYRHWILCNA